ncbi:MAG TPA: UDP-3-O-(3-hydroxymyristoyl)glucosamine N-acyltransferase [Phycisphaerales bacterium]|nr:UDP-3-O-(3-hydroxymyristoyl)glucosamine N-acyltransferase [Phycisphaerales bacterium]
MQSARRYAAGKLATLVGGEVIGDATAEVTTLEAIDRAGPGALTYVRDEKYLAMWPASGATVAIVARSAWDRRGAIEVGAGRAVVVVEDADRALAGLLESIKGTAGTPVGRHPSAVIDPSAVLGEDVAIGAGAVIGAGVVIGAGSMIHERAVVRQGCVLGERVVIGAGAVIGSEGFGLMADPKTGMPTRIPHAGNVVIGDDVEIGANTTVDRAKFGSTTIGAGTKIDNLVQIAHGCRIGRGCIICGCCALSGSVELGDGVMLAGSVGIADNVRVGDRVTIGARSGVKDDIPAGEVWVGYPAEEARRQLRTVAAIRSLADVMPKIKKLIKRFEGEGQG